MNSIANGSHILRVFEDLVTPHNIINMDHGYLIFPSRKEGRNGLLRRFQELRSHRDEIVSRSREEILVKHHFPE